MLALGLETSCDETGVALYDSQRGLLAHQLFSQVPIHEAYGGVVPELASRDHIRKTIPLIREVMNQAGVMPEAIDGIAFTKGPGLMGALFVGAMIGRSLAFAWNIPAIGVHHMEGHLLAPLLAQRLEFPFVALLVSGGHSQLILTEGVGRYQLLGETQDDAAGEAFDKVASLLKLSYPGGPRLAELANAGNLKRWTFPRPMVDRPGLDLSFSGLKTHCRQLIERLESHGQLDEQSRSDIACAFQEAVTDTLFIKCKRAIEQTGVSRLVLAGGVSANQRLRSVFKEKFLSKGVELYYPPAEFCTDNGAMIAYAGCQRLMAGEREPLEIKVFPRWPLESLQPPGQT